ncbi:MAG: hypothetical protein R3F20_17000 [Planctomycetota bacterium]
MSKTIPKGADLASGWDVGSLLLGLVAAFLGSLAAAPGCETKTAPPLSIAERHDLGENRSTFAGLVLDERRDRVWVAFEASAPLVLGRSAEDRPPAPSEPALTRGILALPHRDAMLLHASTGELVLEDAGDGRALARRAGLDAGAMAADETGGRIWVARERGLAALDAETLAARAELTLKKRPLALAVETRGARLFARGLGGITVVDRAKAAVLESWPLTEPDGDGDTLVLDEPHARLYLAGARLLVLHTQDGSRIDAVDLPGRVVNLHHDTRHRRLYAVIEEGRVLTFDIADPDHPRLTQDLELDGIPGASAWDQRRETLRIAVTDRTSGRRTLLRLPAAD